MKRLFTIISLFLVILITGGCSTTRGVKVTSCSVSSITPNGLKGIKAILDVGIINPMMNLTITKINGVINNNGQEFATFEAGKVSVPRKSEGVYPLPCSGVISKGIGLSDLLKLALNQNFDGMTVDPCIPADWKEFSVTRKWRGAEYRIHVSNPEGVEKGVFLSDHYPVEADFEF